MAKRDGPCGSACGPQVKNAGRANLFNPLARGPLGPAVGHGGAGWPANPQEKKMSLF